MGETLAAELLGGAQARQQARRLAEQEFRPRRTAVGVGAALLVTAAGGAVSAELLTVLDVLPDGWSPMARSMAVLRGLTWADPWTLGVAGTMAAAGPALLLAALPGRARTLPLAGEDPLMAGAVGRAALRRTLADAAVGVPGVVRARVRLRGRFRKRIVVRAATGYRNRPDISDLVRAAVHARLAEVELMQWRRVDIRLNRLGG
ncbi:DUF6286 domain-containing protein [Actinomadura xylanilytica]|uniref:DUF6286 domain-containing protein n=1 Tax=Actinomadura xylanilytica TaxID=887459 RepID=UPI00255AB32D|nr:DUF6286 domain-containing protein [Actinomadura xylanilytica]MDL4775645.1 DUF6286 domain-containing protein [Actinomadura xylanilytica]